MYKQIDGVAISSPLGPALANIFVRYPEEKSFIGRLTIFWWPKNGTLEDNTTMGDEAKSGTHLAEANQVLTFSFLELIIISGAI